MPQDQDYQAFLDQKRIVDVPTGLTEIPELNPQLFPFQRDIVRWALRRGRAAVFAGTGLGKSAMQLEVARHVPGNVLILAPLAVASQTVQEGKKFGIDLKYCRNQSQVDSKITITNYEMLEHFDPTHFNCIEMDESSLLKSHTGAYRNLIIETFKHTPFRYAFTATPAPNDYMELGNHSEFLGIMSRAEMLAMFFIHDGGDTSKWRLKGHAESEYWKWLASWAVMINMPSNLGYEDGGFKLPELQYHQRVVTVENTGPHLFAMEAKTLQEQQEARRNSVEDRVRECVELVSASVAEIPSEKWLIWCHLNDEQDRLEKALKEKGILFVSIKGSTDIDDRIGLESQWREGNANVLITKPSVFGWGMNWQHCSKMAFVGISHSFESFYQAVRRCWRFGQTKPVDVYMIVAETEGAVLTNLQRKEQDAERMTQNMIEHMSDLNKENLQGTQRDTCEYRRDVESGNGWTVHLGDCVDVAKEIDSNSIHYSIYSPPFASLYVYSASDRDMGNCKGIDDFGRHFRFLAEELYRVLMPGRLMSFHCMNLPTSKTHHGYIGIQDFRGDLIRLFQEVGFIYHSEVCIWKDPVTAMQRTKALGLLHKQLKKDSCMSRQGIPDYLVTMRKPGENGEPVNHTDESFPVGIWQRYASPVWMDINPSNTLQHRSAREEADERHICPLQLQVIERGLELWTNPGDLVFSPFAGIGSEGYVAVKMGRRFVGSELKPSYFAQSVANLRVAEHEAAQVTHPLFAAAGLELSV